MQLESLVSIQSEIINYLSNNEHPDKNHPLLEVSRRLQQSLISASPRDKPAFNNGTGQNTPKNAVVDDVEVESIKASEQLRHSDPEVSPQPEDNENSSDGILRHRKPPTSSATFQRNSNIWRNSMEIPLFLTDDQAGDHFADRKSTLKKRYTTHFSLPPATTSTPTVEAPQRLENERGDRIVQSDSTNSNSASSISSESEIEITTPLRRNVGNGVRQSLIERGFPRITENSNATTLVVPMAKNLNFCEWVSSQRNNNKRSERGGEITAKAEYQSYTDTRNVCNYDITDFINACHLLQQSLENPKSIPPSKIMNVMPILRDYWFHNTTSSDVTVESLESLLSVISQFPPSVAGRVVNQRDKEGHTFLHIAVRKRRWELIETALEACREFDLDRTDARGRTPLLLMVNYASQLFSAGNSVFMLSAACLMVVSSMHRADGIFVD
ncbi:hypothetical protein EGR_02843 [Echinococcus granulosus]|uniref:Uncharacterized protein n=1 Tax=Echinococcus granulosus TaxID=6210 RepID=W6ULI0_ECHGR|nr:hypothetical protein EGR_02843 [Echinococcus granulosus]EUB62390.1 hypothetical protein EGR_02843 [Echinococcus granulosus]